MEMSKIRGEVWGQGIAVVLAVDIGLRAGRARARTRLLRQERSEVGHSGEWVEGAQASTRLVFWKQGQVVKGTCEGGLWRHTVSLICFLCVRRGMDIHILNNMVLSSCYRSRPRCVSEWPREWLLLRRRAEGRQT